MQTVDRVERYFACALVVSVCISICGCYSPGSRIKNHAEVFATFSPEVQENVRRGEVEMGYTQDMVFIALGKPDRKYVRYSERGQTEVWSYVTTEYWTDRQRVNISLRVRSADGHRQTVRDRVWVDVQQEREHERMRVEFDDGQVSAIERIER